MPLPLNRPNRALPWGYYHKRYYGSDLAQHRWGLHRNAW